MPWLPNFEEKILQRYQRLESSYKQADQVVHHEQSTLCGISCGPEFVQFHHGHWEKSYGCVRELQVHFLYQTPTQSEWYKISRKPGRMVTF